MHLEFLDASLTTHPAEKSRCRSTGKRFLGCRSVRKRSSRGDGFVLDPCAPERQDVAPAPASPLLLAVPQQGKSPVCASLASCFPRHLSGFRLTFPSSSPQCVLSDNGADSAASHRGGSTLLRSLNLPQHTGMLCRAEQTGFPFFPSFRSFSAPVTAFLPPRGRAGGPVFTSPLPERPSASNRAHLRSCVSSLHR